jgi:hypothetical protein
MTLYFTFAFILFWHDDDIASLVFQMVIRFWRFWFGTKVARLP